MESMEQQLKKMNNLEQIKQFKIQKGLKCDKPEIKTIIKDAQIIYER